MNLRKNILELTTRYGKPAKFSVQAIASIVFPGSKELIELIGHYFDVAQGTAIDNITADAMKQAESNEVVLKALETIIGEISTNQHEIMGHLSKFNNYVDQERELRLFLTHNTEILHGLQRTLDQTGWNIELRLIRIEQNLKRFGAAGSLSAQDEFEYRVFRLSKSVEAWMRDRYGAEGGGLGSLLADSISKGALRDRALLEAIRDFVPIRNSIIHDHNAPSLSARESKIVERLEGFISSQEANAQSSIARIRFTKSQYFVDASGIGDFSTITEAIMAAADGDEIFVLAGEYYETLFIDKEVRIIGQIDGQHRPKLIAGGDMAQIFSNGVSMECIDFVSNAESSFGLIVFPDARGVLVKNCGVEVTNGTGLVALRNSELILEEMRVSRCRYGLRIEGYGIVTKSGFVSCEYGVVARNFGQSRIGDCHFIENGVGIYLDSGANGNVRSNVFQGSGFAVIAVNGSMASLALNDLTGCSNKHPTAILDDSSDLTFVD